MFTPDDGTSGDGRVIFGYVTQLMKFGARPLKAAHYLSCMSRSIPLIC
jgi:hypothetical protein